MRDFLGYMGIPFDVKVPKTLPDYVEASDIDQIVDWIKSKQSHKKSIQRDLTLLQSAKRTGIRRSALGNIRVKDISPDKNRLFCGALRTE